MIYEALRKQTKTMKVKTEDVDVALPKIIEGS